MGPLLSNKMNEGQWRNKSYFLIPFEKCQGLNVQYDVGEFLRHILMQKKTYSPRKFSSRGAECTASAVDSGFNLAVLAVAFCPMRTYQQL